MSSTLRISRRTGRERLTLRLPLDHALGHQRHQRQQRQQRGDGEGRRRSCIRCRGSRRAAAGVGQAADVAGHHRHRAELAHRAGVAQDHAVEQAPLDVRQRDAEEGLPAAGAQRSAAASSSSVPCACISGISSRATNGKVTNIVASTMPGTAKMILMSCADQPGPEPALQRRTAARRSGRRSPATPRTAGRSA